MNKFPRFERCLLLAGLYDGVLGLAFLWAAPRLFAWLELTPPIHFGYVRFSAALLIVFALMFFAVAVNPTANRNLIPFGMLLKVSYTGVVGFYWFGEGVPWIWKPFWVFDLIFLALFIWAYASLCRPAKAEPA